MSRNTSLEIEYFQLEDWWYNVYTEIRDPLAPYVSFGALNTVYNCVDGGQISRAADVLHHWLSVWDKIRQLVFRIILEILRIFQWKMASNIFPWCHLGYGSIPSFVLFESYTSETKRHYGSIF